MKIEEIELALASNPLPLIEDPKDERDFEYVDDSKDLPEVFSRRSEMTPVKDQGKRGTCTAFTVAGLAEWIEKKKTGKDIDLSEQFLFDVTKVLDELARFYSHGSTIRTAMKALQKKGICEEKFFKYEPKARQDIYKTQVPSREAFKDAAKRKIEKYRSVVRVVTEIEKAVYNVGPLPGGVRLYRDFRHSRKTGILPPPKTSKDKFINHGILVVGYDRKRKLIEVKNSWGEDYGDEGYSWIPYDYFPNHVLSFWTL